MLLNENTCIRKVQRVNFLRHELKPEVVRHLKRYVDSIEHFSAPKTIEELQSFLGLVNYVNKWVPRPDYRD